MAQESGQKESIRDLKQQIAHSRDRLARDLDGLRYELNFPLKLRKSFQRKAGLWVASSAVLGVILSVIPSRTKKVTIKTTPKGKIAQEKEGILGAGIALGALKLTGRLLQPVVANMIAKKMSSVASRSMPPRP